MSRETHDADNNRRLNMRTLDVMRTQRGYVVDSPDADGDIEIEVPDSNFIWLNKKDLLAMLALFDNPT